MNVALREVKAEIPSWTTLPGWTYDNAAFFALEKEHLFLANWQLVCHVSEVRAPGDFATLKVHGERAVVIRDEDGALNAFYNVCRHRAAAVLDGQGNCGAMVQCPYHGWVYRLDGALKAVPAEGSFPEFDRSEFGLKRIEVEEFQGWVFVKFRRGGPSVAERLAPYAAEMAPYRFAEMQPLGPHWNLDIPVDWKNVMDNYLEGYHVPIGHPGLYRMFGQQYDTEVRPGNVSRALHQMRDKRSPVWSEGLYQSLLPALDHLPEDRRRAWAYYTLLPNLAFDTYPDRVSYFQVLPTAPGKCVLHGRAYALPTADRALKAAQWLNGRINTQVQREDEWLVASVQEGLASECYTTGILSEKENCLRQFHDMVRKTIPVAGLPKAPDSETLRRYMPETAIAAE